jgi:hypothetical protein
VLARTICTNLHSNLGPTSTLSGALLSMLLLFIPYMGQPDRNLEPGCILLCPCPALQQCHAHSRSLGLKKLSPYLLQHEPTCTAANHTLTSLGSQMQDAFILAWANPSHALLLFLCWRTLCYACLWIFPTTPYVNLAIAVYRLLTPVPSY